MAPNATAGVTGALTDGTGVSPITWTKLAKDFSLDFLLGISSALGTDAAFEVLDIGNVIEAPEAVVVGVIGAAVRAGFRIWLRWASTP